MKKLMFAAALAAAGSVFAAGEITSKNIVGYMNKDNDAKPYPTYSCMFKTPDGSGTFKLGDILPKNMVWNDDFIQFLDPVSGAIDTTKMYTYWTDETQDIPGWYDKNDGVTYCNELPVPFGTAFVATFADPSIPHTFTFAGEVETADMTVVNEDSDTKAALPYIFVGNPYPAELPLGNIVPTNMTWLDDFIQFLDPSTGAIDTAKMYTYWTDETQDVPGWYDKNDGVTYCNSVKIPAGDGFITTFTGKVTLQITSPIKK